MRYAPLVTAQRDEDLEALEAAEDRSTALATQFDRHRHRLLRMIELRMDPAMRQRVGASDVLQETWLEVSGRIADWLADPRMPFFVWVRFIAAQRLQKLRRYHVGAKKRSLEQQVGLGAFARATSVALTDRLIVSGISPSGAAVRAEMRLQLEDALETMPPTDREVLVLRHFEQLSNNEVATELGISVSAASRRYVRALDRLRTVLDADRAP